MISGKGKIKLGQTRTSSLNLGGMLIHYSKRKLRLCQYGIGGLQLNQCVRHIRVALPSAFVSLYKELNWSTSQLV